MEKANKKIVSVAINLKDIDKPPDFFNTSFEKKTREKLTKELLDLPVNFKDSIDFVVRNDKVIFFWQLPKINDRAEKLHQSAMQFAKHGELGKAIQGWKEATMADAYNPEYFFNLGVACFEQKNYMEAIDALTRALSICPIYHRAHLILGTCYIKIRKFENAKKHIEKSLTFDKNNALTYLNLGTVYSVLKDYKMGAKMFEKAIELSPREPRAYLGMGKIYSTLGKNGEANAYFKRVIEFDSKGNLANYAKRLLISFQQQDENSDVSTAKYDNPEDYYSQGYRLYLGGDFQKSSQMYKNYLSVKPDDDFVWCALGEAQLRKGDIKLAVESFKKAARISPQKSLYFKELAIALYLLKEYDKVIAAVSKAKELGKTDSVSYCIWGKALFELGNVNESIIMLDYSLKSNRNNLLAKYFLAEALVKNGELDNAIGYLDQIINSKLQTPLKKRSEKLKQELMREEHL